MKRVVILLVSVVVLSLVLAACGEEALGVIRILSVTPDSGLIDGQAEVDVYGLVVSEAVIVAEGSGQHTFHTTGIQAKDWSPGGDFKAYANISEYPHDSPWTPLDLDTMVLTF